MCVAHLLAVHPHVGGAIHAIEVQVYLSSVPCGRHFHHTAVAAHGIRLVQDGVAFLSLDEGRQVAEGIGHIGIDGCAVALHLPARRHGYLLPLLVVETGLVEVHGSVLGLCRPVELPHAVEREAQAAVGAEPRLLICLVAPHLALVGIEQHGGTSGLLVYPKDGLVLPVVLAPIHIGLHGYLQIGLHQTPLHGLVRVLGLHLPHGSAGLAVVVVAQLESASRTCEGVGVALHRGQLPLLVGVSGVHVPRAHLARLSVVVAVVEGHLGLRIDQREVSRAVRLLDVPHLVARLLVHRVEGHGASRTFQGQSVTYLQTVALCGREFLSRTRGPWGQKGKQHQSHFE